MGDHVRRGLNVPHKMPAVLTSAPVQQTSSSPMTDVLIVSNQSCYQSENTHVHFKFTVYMFLW